MAKDGLTPMMRQFYEFKSKHPDALLLFRCGDFYETYDEDATKTSEVLGITLTRRNNGTTGADTAMAGFPYHALDTYLPRLVRAGLRVAICDQLEDPKLAKTIVKRGITELVTPGTTMNENVLPCRENNFLAAVHFGRAECGIALLDLSTGEFLTTEGPSDRMDKLLHTFLPKEVIYERGKSDVFNRVFGDRFVTYPLDDWAFSESTARGRLLKHFGVANLKGFGVEHLKAGPVAAGACLQYMEYTKHTELGHITTLRRIEEEQYVRLDKFTIRSLELLNAMHEGGASLLDVIDRTITPMGARMLRRWVMFPLKDMVAIRSRQDVVDCFFRHPRLRQLVTDNLRQIGDMERIVGKASVGRVSPRDVVQLRVALEALVPIRQACLEADDPTLRSLGTQFALCEDLRNRIARELNPEPPLLVNKGNVVASGVNAELDELRKIAFDGKDYLLELQNREAQRTGIQSLKVAYNNVFGYYLEVRNTYKDLVPDTWIRKQTLVNAERYITQELKEYESRIMGAEEKILALEAQIYNALVQTLTGYTASLQTTAALLAKLDALLSFALVAAERKYIRPIVDESEGLLIRQGRHPVIESRMGVGEHYVPNDVELNSAKQQIIIITGPNMAGKSALLRQTALIVLMAQMGCFVPAESARIGFVDKIFTRVGASDNISEGESTFMVEMNEAASIVNNLSPRSLVLFDELGRGTSTYDGISIAWAIVEHIHERANGRPRTLFATHYHELNEMEKHFNRIKNFNVRVSESEGKIVFLRKLERGGSAHSFGIHVARLAGMHPHIVQRANELLEQMEQKRDTSQIALPLPKAKKNEEATQLNFFQLDDPALEQVRDKLLGLDIDHLTPLEALNRLHEIRQIVKSE